MLANYYSIIIKPIGCAKIDVIYIDTPNHFLNCLTRFISLPVYSK